MSIKLKPINRGPRDNRYCGPAVVSFITGKNTSDVSRFIRNRYRNGIQGQRNFVRGTYTEEVTGVLSALGYTLNRLRLDRGRPTLAGWLKSNKELRSAGRVFLLVAGNHYQLISGRKYACGRIGEIVSIRHPRVKRRCRVTEVWEVVRTHPVWAKEKKDEWQQYVSSQTPRRTNDSYKVRKMMRQYPQYGFSYELDYRDTDGLNVYFVSMSNELEDKADEMGHHLSDEHYCDGMDGVHGRMLTMLEFAKQHH